MTTLSKGKITIVGIDGEKHTVATSASEIVDLTAEETNTLGQVVDAIWTKGENNAGFDTLCKSLLKIIPVLEKSKTVDTVASGDHKELISTGTIVASGGRSRRLRRRRGRKSRRSRR